ncbi:MAG: phosphoribosylamine--glycine ligase [Chloroflexi bacterium]|nr:phosphoribosylamine--glycine ligase [Chloroflexota bacterium]
MNVLLVGSGGREHAIAWKLRQSDNLGRLFTAPGNAGTAELGENIPVRDTDISGLLASARNLDIGLTFVGPEAPLAAGVVDAFTADGRLIFGPTRAAARLESSKVWAKQFMSRHGIPTAKATAFRSAVDALAYIDRMPENDAVIKADGLAAGKGVVVANSKTEAREAVRAVFSGGLPSDAVSQVLVEQKLSGPEVSVFAFVDGEHVSAEVAACDYKRVGDGDTGPNTGGMGAYSPPEFWTPDLASRIRREILEPAASGMVNDGSLYHGVLYAGLMVTRDGPRVIEFNCRLGDPEAQVVLPQLDCDLLELALAVAERRLPGTAVRWQSRPHVGVVLASGGYPGKYETGFEIEGLEKAAPAIVFHAGTKRADGKLLTSGGRVLSIVAAGSTVTEARLAACAAAAKISFKNAIFRRDIGLRAGPQVVRGVTVPRPGSR